MGLEKINAPRVGLSAPQLLPAPPRPAPTSMAVYTAWTMLFPEYCLTDRHIHT